MPQPPKKRVGSFQSHDISAIFDDPRAAEILCEVEKSAIHLKKHGTPRDPGIWGCRIKAEILSAVIAQILSRSREN